MIFADKVVPLAYNLKQVATAQTGKGRRLISHIKNKWAQNKDTKKVTVTVQGIGGPQKTVLYVDLRKTIQKLNDASKENFTSEQFAKLLDDREKRIETLQNGLSPLEKEFKKTRDSVKASIEEMIKKEPQFLEGKKIIEYLDRGKKIPFSLVPDEKTDLEAEVKKYNDFHEGLFKKRYELMKAVYEEDLVRNGLEKDCLSKEIEKLKEEIDDCLFSFEVPLRKLRDLDPKSALGLQYDKILLALWELRSNLKPFQFPEGLSRHVNDYFKKLDDQNIFPYLQTCRENLAKKRMELFFLEYKDDWFEDSLSTSRGILFNSRTSEGERIINEDLKGATFKDSFGIHSIIVRYHPDNPNESMKPADFEICMRMDNTKVHGEGTYKKVVHADVWRTQKTYAWYILKGDSVVKDSETTKMKEFFVLIKGHPGFFQPLEEPVDFYTGKGKWEKDENRNVKNVRKPDQEKYIVLGTEYDGSAGDARRKTGKPVINADALVLLADSLVFMHGIGFVHRDLKPANYLVKSTIVEIADYDFVERTDEAFYVTGTSGYIPLGFVFSGLFGYRLSDKNRSPQASKNGLEQADLFAHALSMWQDLDPSVNAWGYRNDKDKGYYEEIHGLIKKNKDPNIQIDPKIEKFFKDLAEKNSISSEEFQESIDLIRTSQGAELSKLKGYREKKKNKYHKEIYDLIIANKANIKIDPKIEKFFKDLAENNPINPKEFRENVKLVKKEEEQLQKLWIEKKTQEHVLRKPQQSIEFSEYRMLLWEATHPNPQLQITPKEFAERLKILKVQGKLP